MMLRRKYLKLFRIEQDLTQQQMADRLKISSSHYANIEYGKFNPSYKVTEEFYKQFGKDELWRLIEKG